MLSQEGKTRQIREQTLRTEVRKTVCGVCMVGCGVDAYVEQGRLVAIKGSAENPTNRGTLCRRGRASLEYTYHQDRIMRPLLRKVTKGGQAHVAIGWEEAFGLIEEKLTAAKTEYGPESVAFYVGYPKWLRPFLKRLAHGFGSPNYCSESSTCYFATAMANRLTYGCIGYPDLKHTRCIVNWSTNPHSSSLTRLRAFKAARENGAKLIDVGVLKTPLARQADVHLQIRPGTSGALALALAHVIIAEQLYDTEFVENWTIGFDAFRDYVAEFSPTTGETITGVPARSIVEAARLYAGAKPAAMVNSASVTVHHTNGVQNHRAITALIGLTGNFDRRGGNHVMPSTYYHVPTGLVSREHEFEQVCGWEDMAPRVGGGNFPGLGCVSARSSSDSTALSDPDGSPIPRSNPAGVRDESPYVARVGLYEEEPAET